MSTIIVMPDDSRTNATPYRPVSGDTLDRLHPSQALNALQTKCGKPTELSFVIVHDMIADTLVMAVHRDRLVVLMAR